MNAKSHPNPPKVFISYSHDSPEHEVRVLALSDRLREEGVDCQLDQYEHAPEEGWLLWMTKQIKWADFVLMICTEKYYRRVMGEETPGEGKGATREGQLINQTLYDANGCNNKFIAVLFDTNDEPHIPDWMRAYTHYCVHDDEDYELLYRRLTNQHGTPKPELGKVKKMPPRERARGAGAQATDGAARDPDADIPRHSGDLLKSYPEPQPKWVGRTTELGQLNAAWDGGSTRVFTVVGFGGQGKSALARRFTESLRKIRTPSAARSWFGGVST